MTLCIAAACRDFRKGVLTSEYDSDQCVVFSTDRRIEGPNKLAAHDEAIKISVLSGRWFALYAGTVWHAQALLSLYKALVRANNDELFDDEIADVLYGPFTQFRTRLANIYCWQKLAMSYEQYVEILKVQPQAFRDDLAVELEAQVADASLLLIGIVNHRLRIFECSADCGIRDVEDFGIIGSGYYTAESILYQRKQTPLSSLAHTVYAVYEAHKTAGGFVPGVSEKFEIGAISYDSETDGLVMHPLNYDGRMFLDDQYKRYGPKPLTLELSDDSLTEHFFAAAIPLRTEKEKNGASEQAEEKRAAE